MLQFEDITMCFPKDRSPTSFQSVSGKIILLPLSWQYDRSECHPVRPGKWGISVCFLMMYERSLNSNRKLINLHGLLSSRFQHAIVWFNGQLLMQMICKYLKKYHLLYKFLKTTATTSKETGVTQAQSNLAENIWLPAVRDFSYHCQSMLSSRFLECWMAIRWHERCVLVLQWKKSLITVPVYGDIVWWT